VGTRELLDKIIADAEERAKAIQTERAEQEHQIAERLKETEARLRAESEELLRKRTAAILENSRSRAELEKKKLLLAVKWRIIGQVCEEAKKAVLTSPDYPETLNRLIARYARGEEVVIHLSPQDTAEYGKKLKAKLGEPMPIAGGLVIRTRDAEFDLSLDSLLNIAKDELITQLARLLFSD